MTIQIRNYRPNDLELIVVLINAADAVDRTEMGTSVIEQRERMAMPGLLPEENVYVAEDERGQLVAYGLVKLFHEDDKDGFRVWMEVHPRFRGRGLEERMLSRMEQRARERFGETTKERVYFDCATPDVNVDRLKVLERAGMHEIRRFWTMLRPNLPDLPAPRFPQGYEVRAFRPGQDDVEALDALNDSFSEHFGHTQDTMEEFQQYIHLPWYRSDLTVVAFESGTQRMAGFCHVAVNTGECERLGRQRGWIDILGVRKGYRRKGLGEALILQGMWNMRQAGMNEAVLGCDSENTTNATALYFRTGFHVHTTRILYSKFLRAPEIVEPEPAMLAAH